MQVNGKAYPHRPALTLLALLAELDIDQRRVVVMQGDVIHRAGKIPDVPVGAEDVIEIVTMMQGG